MSDKKLSHLNAHGEANMVDISGKETTDRSAVAEGTVSVSEELLSLLKENGLKKGDALSVARIAGIQAAKATDKLIPLCHSLPLSKVSVDFEFIDRPASIKITAFAKTSYKTGVEMEALTAVSVAALTICDMGKSIDKAIVIENIRLLSKTGGKSGTYLRKE